MVSEVSYPRGKSHRPPKLGPDRMAVKRANQQYQRRKRKTEQDIVVSQAITRVTEAYVRSLRDGRRSCARPPDELVLDAGLLQAHKAPGYVPRHGRAVHLYDGLHVALPAGFALLFATEYLCLNLWTRIYVPPPGLTQYARLDPQPWSKYLSAMFHEEDFI